MEKKRKKAKKAKRVKLESKARIRRRLMKLWTMAVHAEFGERCAVCGSQNLPNAHHIESRIMFKGLRYDPMNGVLLCPTHHKFGKDSAHMAGCWFARWLAENLPARYEYVLAHHADPDPNLEDRAVLAAIEESLRAHIAKYTQRKTCLTGCLRKKMHDLAGTATETEVRNAMNELLLAGEITPEQYTELESEIFKPGNKELQKGTTGEDKPTDQG